MGKKGAVGRPIFAAACFFQRLSCARAKTDAAGWHGVIFAMISKALKGHFQILTL